VFLTIFLGSLAQRFLITALAVIGAPTLVVKWISRIWEAAMRTSELKWTLEAAIRW
jgi:hypothetical protein